ncbi:MAG: FHA domain-containing protein [Lentisphaeria bacterium]|nr:FHA domain-containing protein [Lentisphaeria bacterium]
MGVSSKNDVGKPGLLQRFKSRSGRPERLSVRLEFNRRVLYESCDFSAADVVTIGRSADCVWVIPPEDSVASGHHAVILMRKGKLCLRDTGSRNGIFYRARRIQEKMLAPGDQFSIGSCTLIVERVKFSGAAHHELVYLNTDKKGQSVRLVNAVMTLGSAPGCDIPVTEQLVSQRHAEFSTKADGCWIRDLGSKNGTFVNGTKLAVGTERLLVDDDVVSTAFVDFRFVDGSIEHTKIRIWSSLGVVAATVFAVFLLNLLWMGMRSSAEDCIGKARNAAAAERFDEARRILLESRSLRGAERTEIAFNELNNSIAVWEKVYDNWGKAKTTLASGNWVEGSHLLGMITSADPNVWGWNDSTAPGMRSEAFAAKKLLDAYLRADTFLRSGRESGTLSDLRRITEDLAEGSRPFAAKTPEYLAKLQKESGTLRKQISANFQYLENLEMLLKRVAPESENLAALLSDLDELRRNAEPGIQLRIANCMVPLTMLQKSCKQIKRAIRAVQQLDFDGLAGIRLELPTLEQCSVHAEIATLRRNQERQFEFVQGTASALRPVVRQLGECGLTADTPVPVCVAMFLDEKIMRQVFSCDALAGRMPSRLRTEPAGCYDRVLGIEGFFEYMYSLPASYDPAVYAESRFRPEIVRLREALGAAENFLRFAEQPQVRWLHAGEFRRLHAHAAELLKFPARLAKLYPPEKAADAREKLLRRAVLLFLARGAASEKEAGDFAADLKNYRMPLIKLGRTYNTAPDEEKIVIRDSILKRGLPGDPVVRRMWGFKKYSK